MDQFLNEAVTILVPAAGGLLLALVSWALAELTRYVKRKTDSEAVNNAIARICAMTETTVAELNQTVVDGLRKAAADGHIDADEASDLKALALARIKQRMAAGVLDIAATGVADLNAFIAARIERAVREQKVGLLYTVSSAGDARSS
jgi:hypothetical protein